MDGCLDIRCPISLADVEVRSNLLQLALCLGRSSTGAPQPGCCSRGIDLIEQMFHTAYDFKFRSMRWAIGVSPRTNLVPVICSYI